MKTKTINLYETGGPDNMIWEDVNLPEPSKGEVLLKHEFVGFNMIDTYHRSGIYSTPNKPCGLGTEASGIIEKIVCDGKKLKIDFFLIYTHKFRWPSPLSTT